MLGDGATGKTALLVAYKDKKFPEEYLPTGRLYSSIWFSNFDMSLIIFLFRFSDGQLQHKGYWEEGQ